MVERITPDGYLLLNGHHRWAAAIKTGLPKIHAEVVNLTQQKDIYEMLSRSKNNKRVVLDLDEVVFRAEFDELSEKPLRFAFGRIINEPMRLGIPALFNDLKRRGYDIWVYTSRYVSYESMRHYFRRRGHRSPCRSSRPGLCCVDQQKDEDLRGTPDRRSGDPVGRPGDGDRR